MVHYLPGAAVIPAAVRVTGLFETVCVECEDCGKYIESHAPAHWGNNTVASACFPGWTVRGCRKAEATLCPNCRKARKRAYEADRSFYRTDRPSRRPDSEYDLTFTESWAPEAVEVSVTCPECGAHEAHAVPKDMRPATICREIFKGWTIAGATRCLETLCPTCLYSARRARHNLARAKKRKTIHERSQSSP